MRLDEGRIRPQRGSISGSVFLKQVKFAKSSEAFPQIHIVQMVEAIILLIDGHPAPPGMYIEPYGQSEIIHR